MDGGQSPLGPGGRERWVVLGGLLCVVCLSAWLRFEPHSYLRRDASFYATITRGLSEYGSLRAENVQPMSWYEGDHPGYRELDASWSNVSVGVNGEKYPKHSFVMSALAVPFYALLGTEGLLLFNLLGVVALLFGAYLLAERHVRGPPLLMALALMATGTTFVDHMYHFSADIFSAALCIWGLQLIRCRRALGAGFLLGLALWARPTLALLIVPMSMALGRQSLDRHGVRQLFLGGLPPLLMGAAANWVMFGAPWVTSYDRIWVVHNGIPAIESATSLFTLGIGEGLDRLFLSPKDGLLYTSPAVILAACGLVLFHKARPLVTSALLLAILAFVGVFATYRYSNPRFFFAWMALLVTPLALLLERSACWASQAFHGSRSQRRNRALWSLAALLIGLTTLAWTQTNTATTLSDRLPQALVLRNDRPCDYFNMRHGRWECSKLERRTWEWVGRALGATDCLFDGRKEDMIFFHPPSSGQTKEIAFPVERGERTLRLRVGLADSATGHRTCLKVEVGNATKELCVHEPGELLSHDVSLDESAWVNLLIKGRPGGRRHLCLQGEFLP